MEPAQSEGQGEDQWPRRRLERGVSPGCWGQDPNPDTSELGNLGPEYLPGLGLSVLICRME